MANQEIDEFSENQSTHPVTATQATTLPYAGFWLRCTSMMHDAAINALFVAFVFAIILPSIHSTLSTESYLKFFLYFVLPFFLIGTIGYQASLNARGGRSFGKKWLGISVVDYNLDPITLAHSLKRSLLAVVDIPGLLYVPFNSKKQTIHDLLSHTYVIQPSKRNHTAIKIIGILVVSFVLVLLATNLLRRNIQAFRIPTTSMKPTLLVDDHIYIDKLWAHKSKPIAGDLIVFRYPRDTSLLYLKRCVAVGGQKVEIRDDELYVNDRPEGNKKETVSFFDVSEEHTIVSYQVSLANGTDYFINYYDDVDKTKMNWGPMMVPADHYYVLGDNRDNSHDSRHFGFVPAANITGKAGIIYWSIDRNSPLWDIGHKIRWDRLGKGVH